MCTCMVFSYNHALKLKRLHTLCDHWKDWTKLSNTYSTIIHKCSIKKTWQSLLMLFLRSKLSAVSGSALQNTSDLPNGVKVPQSVLASEPIPQGDIMFVSIWWLGSNKIINKANWKGNLSLSMNHNYILITTIMYFEIKNENESFLLNGLLFFLLIFRQSRLPKMPMLLYLASMSNKRMN